MKMHVKFLLTVLVTFVVSSGWAQKTVPFYVGTFTSEGGEGIVRCSFDTESGKISRIWTYRDIENPSFLKLSPSRRFLFAVSREVTTADDVGGYVNAFGINAQGKLVFYNKQSTRGKDPCHVDVAPDGHYVAIANYGGGSTAMYPVLADGRLGELVSFFQNEGEGPNKSRQKSPHAHSIKFSPFSNQVFSADLGTDQLNIYQLAEGKLMDSEQKFVAIEPGAGPRHFDFHPTGKAIYLVNELNSTVNVIKKVDGDWKVVQSLSSLPKDYKGKNSGADIHVSADGRFVYSSNRGHNSIAVFAVRPGDQKLIFKTTVSVEGNWPRNFSLSPDGKWLLVANQYSHDIVVFHLDRESGVPKYSGHKFAVKAPVCIELE